MPRHSEGEAEIRLVPEYQKKFAKTPGIHITPDRDNFDYVYKAQLLATLKGWRLDGKRGFIKKFRAQYPFQYEPYRKEFEKDCLKLMESWLASRESVDPTARNEYEAVRIFLDHWDALGAQGGIITVEGKLVAFSFGEKLNDTMFVVHFEKADPTYIGSYQMINQQFAEHCAAPGFLFINREQDMGLEGLRKAKQSYAPMKMIKKYTIQF